MLEAREDSPMLNLPLQPMMVMKAINPTENSSRTAKEGISALAAFARFSTNISWNQISGF